MVYSIEVLNPEVALVTNPPPRGDLDATLFNNGPKQVPSDVYASGFAPLLLEQKRVPQNGENVKYVGLSTDIVPGFRAVLPSLVVNNTAVLKVSALLKQEEALQLQKDDDLKRVPRGLQEGILVVLDQLALLDPKDPTSDADGDDGTPGSYYAHSRTVTTTVLGPSNMTSVDAASLHVQMLMAQLDRAWYNANRQVVEGKLGNARAWWSMAAVTPDRGLHDQLVRQLGTLPEGQQLGTAGVWVTPPLLTFTVQQANQVDENLTVYSFLTRRGAKRIPQSLIDYLVDQGDLRLRLDRPGLIVVRPGAVVTLGIVEDGNPARKVTTGIKWQTGIPQSEVWKQVQPPGTDPLTDSNTSVLSVRPTEYGFYVRAQVTLPGGQIQNAGSANVVIYGRCARCSKECYFSLDTMKYQYECRWRKQVSSPVFTEPRDVLLDDTAFKLATHWNRIKQVSFVYHSQLNLRRISPLGVVLAARFYYRLPGAQKAEETAQFLSLVEEEERPVLHNLLVIVTQNAPDPSKFDATAMNRALTGLAKVAREATALGGDVHRMIDELVDMDGLMREHDLARKQDREFDEAYPTQVTPAELEYRGVCRWLTSDPDPLDSLYPGSVVSNVPAFEGRMRDWAASYYASGRQDSEALRNFNQYQVIARESPVL